MTAATASLSAILAALCVLSATVKLQRHEIVVRRVHDEVGVPMEWFPALAALELLGAVGLIAGLWLTPIGVVAAIGLVSYFVGATIAHLRAGDLAGATDPLVPLALSSAVLALHVI